MTIGYSWYSRVFAKEILTKYRNLDVCLIGPALSVIGNLIKALSTNKRLDDLGGIAYRKEGGLIGINNRMDSEIGFDHLPLPSYDLVPSFKPYYVIDPFVSPYALVYSGRGCPFGCGFCNVARTRYTFRSADKVVTELMMLKARGVKYVWFFDEVFTINKERVFEICKKIIENDIGVKWFCDARVDLIDQELLKIMRKSGCIGISYGVESGSQKILNSMKKGHTVEQAKNALILTRKVHIPAQCNLILRYISEDEHTFRETESFVRTTLPSTLQINIINAKPETEFTRLVFENKWAD
jgi:radical SAM superfamily enzyme YgiQ (UPF0313 family)